MLLFIAPSVSQHFLSPLIVSSVNMSLVDSNGIQLDSYILHNSPR